MRILHLIASNFVGGPEKQILRHIRDAAAPGRKFWVGSFHDMPSRPEILDAAERLGIPTLELSSGHLLPLTAFQLACWLRSQNISLLCTHGYKANVIGWLAKRLPHIPQICFARGWTAENWRIRQYERLDRLVLARAPWVATVSQALADQIQKSRRGLNPPVVVPNAALFSDQVAPLPVDRRALRRSLGLEEEGFWVGAVGRLSAEKGHRFLVEALPRVVETIPNLGLVLLGEGRERDALEAQLVRLGLRGRARFAGFQKQVQPWIQACDVLVNPSLSEGMPNVVLEAMALGTPVVATAVGGVPSLITDGQSGLLVSPGDAPAISDALLRLGNDSALSLHLARHAQARVRDYSPERQTRLLFDLYARALQVSRGTGAASEILAQAARATDSAAPARLMDQGSRSLQTPAP